MNVSLLPPNDSTPAPPRPWIVWLLPAIVVVAGGCAWPVVGFVGPLSYNTVVVLMGTSLLGANSGLIGSYAVLRGRALTGDALAHAALPGLCLAFWMLGHRSLPAMLLGALASGVLGVAVISLLHRATRIKQDAAIGIVLSVFFGAGIVLSRLIQNRTAAGSKAGLDSYIFGKTAGMIAQDVALIAAVSGASLLVVLLLYKEFKLVAFDPGFARVQGWPALGLDVLLMVLVAVTVVIGLPTVGIVLTAAMLIMPAAAARFWTDRLGPMLITSAAFGLLTGTLGTAVSARFGLMPAGPIIVLVGSGLFLVSMLLAPRRGAMARAIAQARFRNQLQEQNLLRMLYELAHGDEPQLSQFTAQQIERRRACSVGRLRRLFRRTVALGLVEAVGHDRYRLTPGGYRRAAHVVRSYRLWELFLAEYAELSGSYADLNPLLLEQQLPAELVDGLRSKLQSAGRLPAADPPQSPEQ